MGFTLRDTSLRMDFAPSSRHLAAEGAVAGGAVAWHTGSARFPSRPLLSSFSLALLELAVQPLSLPHHCFRPVERGIDIIWVTVLEGQATSPWEFLEPTTQE